MKLTLNNLFLKLKNYSLITFDMFDTLVTRCINKPDDVFLVVDEYVHNKYKFKSGWFIKTRKKAISLLRKKYGNIDFNIDKIYLEIEKLSSLSHKHILSIKNYEIQTDFDLLIPRKDMLKLFNLLVKEKKRIIIVSDTYYPKKIIDVFLKKCGYKGYEQILTSCDLKKKKRDGSFWKWFFAKCKINTCHVGDDRLADAYHLHLLKKDYVRIRTPLSTLKKSKLAYCRKNIEMQIMCGLIYNKCLFNSPFISYKKSMDSSFKFGYSIYGPLLLHFYIWLIKLTKQNQLLFLSREGYYLQKMYKHFVKCCDSIKENENEYLLTSRRAATFCDVFSWEDIKSLCKKNRYRGGLHNFFQNRFGLLIPEKDCTISIPANLFKVLKIAKAHKNEILDKAKSERDEYLKYLNNFVKNGAFVIDIGYKGTCQYHLSKILHHNLNGAYMIKSYFDYAKKIGCKSYACYRPFPKGVSLKVFAFLVELTFIAPTGQFIKFNKGEPIYNEKIHSESQMRQIQQIFDGVKSFMSDMSILFPLPLESANLDGIKILHNLHNAYTWLKRGYCSEDLVDSLIYENNIKTTKKVKFFKKNE